MNYYLELFGYLGYNRIEIGKRGKIWWIHYE